MSSSMQSHLSKPVHLLGCKYQSKDIKNMNATKITLPLIIAVLSFLTVGCNTLQALEPTAILISDIKNAL
ncbi:hypothetical protein H4W00_001640 [Psychrobacter sp. PL19]